MNCLNCNKPFTPKRITAKYCSDTCRTKHWIQNNSQPAPEPETSRPPLRNLLSSKPGELKPDNQTPDDKQVDFEIVLLNKTKKDIKEWVNSCNKGLHALVNPMNHALTLYDLFFNPTLSCLLNAPYDEFVSKLTRSYNEYFHNVSINRLSKEQANNFQQLFYQEINNAPMRALQVEIELEKLRLMEKPVNKEVVNTENLPPIKPSSTPRQTVVKPDIVKNAEKREVQPGSNILSSRQLTEMEYQAFHFEGKWAEFLGYPAVYFNAVIHGMPGEGKSTFALQFADYLATNCGNVLYVSGEEGFSKTLKDKIVSVNALSEGLFVADYRKYSEMKTQINPNSFNFIFLDSLDTLNMGTEELREFRGINDNTALITISQSTKDGKIRGSNEIVHDADIVVKVENGVAFTTKNRFKEKNQRFEVFSDFKLQNNAKSLRNIF